MKSSAFFHRDGEELEHFLCIWKQYWHAHMYSALKGLLV